MSKDNKMDLFESFMIVLELARQNICDPDEFPEEYERQVVAVEKAQNLAGKWADGLLPHVLGAPRVLFASVHAGTAEEAAKILYDTYGDQALFIESVPGPVKVEGPWRFKVTLGDAE